MDNNSAEQTGEFSEHSKCNGVQWSGIEGGVGQLGDNLGVNITGAAVGDNYQGEITPCPPTDVTGGCQFYERTFQSGA